MVVSRNITFLNPRSSSKPRNTWRANCVNKAPVWFILLLSTTGSIGPGFGILGGSVRLVALKWPLELGPMSKCQAGILG